MMIIWLIYHTQSKKYFLKRIFQEINFMGQRADALQPKREDNAVQSFLDYPLLEHQKHYAFTLVLSLSIIFSEVELEQKICVKMI